MNLSLIISLKISCLNYSVSIHTNYFEFLFPSLVFLQGGSSTASPAERLHKEERLNKLEQDLTHNKGEYEQLNKDHSTAGDNLNDDLENELGEQLEEKQDSLGKTLEKIQELID